MEPVIVGTTIVLFISKSYLPPVERQTLNLIIQRIHDEKLDNIIHCISLDNRQTKHWVQHNTTGVRIDHWPVFVVRLPRATRGQIYSLSQVDEVFAIAHMAKHEIHNYTK